MGEPSAATILEQYRRIHRFDRSTVMPSYGYLWATESPYHYFYHSERYFPTDITLGALVEGCKESTLKQTREIAASFMHAGETGYVKDI